MESNPHIEESGELKPAESKPEIGIWSIMLKVFTAPTEAFQALKQRPQVIWPIVLMILFTFIATIAMTKPSMLMQLDLIAKAKNIPPQVLDQIRANMDKVGAQQMITSGLIGGAAVIIFLLISSGVAMFVGSVLMGGKTGFKSILAVTMVSSLIMGLGGLIRLPLVFAKNSILVSIGFAALMPGKDFTSILFTLLYQYDFFMIWSIIAAGIGYAIIYEFPRSKGMWISIISSLILTLLVMALRLVGLILAGIELSFF